MAARERLRACEGAADLFAMEKRREGDPEEPIECP